MADVQSIFRKHMQQGDATGWFEELYATAQGNTGEVPWARLQPNINLTEWQQREQRSGAGQSALVVGCGLGDDAEFIAREMGYTVTAFDISETAIAWCHERWPDSPVTYQVADLFALPTDFTFDFVFEAYTVQALPPDLHATALRHVAGTVKPGGDLLFICMGRDETQDPGTSPPWPLAPSELAPLEAAGLTLAHTEDYFAAGTRRLRRLYQR